MRTLTRGPLPVLLVCLLFWAAVAATIVWAVQ